ncbi:CAP domain-containing protein [Domibacillus tundrae]|uniref:CAP domain-containing protein n=1 Tax=Domibacillus tundrae TaxID=1587527 RepID=UPI003395ACFF
MKANIRIAAMASLISAGLFTAGQANAAAPTCNVAKTDQFETYKQYQQDYQVKQPVEAAPQQAAPAKAAPQQQQTAPTAQTTAPQQAQPAKTAPQQPAAKSVNAFEQEVAKLVNEERAKAGLKALELDTKLSEVARAKSQDMKDKGYFDHQSPTYGSPFDMMKQFGITYNTAGENIAKGQQTPEEVMKAWMNSDGHRKNILSADFTHIGVGYVDGHWTQMFIGK